MIGGMRGSDYNRRVPWSSAVLFSIQYRPPNESVASRSLVDSDEFQFGSVAHSVRDVLIMLLIGRDLKSLAVIAILMKPAGEYEHYLRLLIITFLNFPFLVLFQDRCA